MKITIDRSVVEQALESLEPYADIKPRDWKTDREKLWRSYDALRAALAEPQELDNGGKTGWPPGLLQDDCRGLSKWLASRPDARQRLREALAQPQEQCKGDPGECEFNGGCMYACSKPEPDTDCHAQGICQRSGHSLGQRKPLTETSAERTLKRMGYTDCGGQFWKPPLGAPAQPQEPVQGPKPLSYADALRIATEAIGRLKSAGPVEGLVGLVRAVEAAHGIK